MLFCSYVLILIGILDNDIKCEGAVYIAEAIKNNKNILEINLCNNRVLDSGHVAILEACKENKSLQSIELTSKHQCIERKALS